MSKPLSVFIDTNVFLAFHHYTKDDIEQLKIVLELINSKKLTLYVTAQVISEYNRNREEKLLQAIKDFTSKGNLPGVPRSMAAYDEAEAYKDALEKISKAKDDLIQLVKADAAARTLPADILFDQIIEKAELIKVTDPIYLKALRRRNSGNPPGKQNTLGDQINWESLLKSVPNGTDLHIISHDGDFASKLTATDVNPYLADEWRDKNGGNLSLHEQLRPFLKDKFPSIQLAIDVEKAEVIDALITSGNFASTHAQVAKLKSMLGSVTWSEADRIFEAGLDNNQIYWIGTDEDVRAFFRELIDKFSSKISAERLAVLDMKFPLKGLAENEEDDDEVPF